MKREFTNALITGAGSGIGQSLCRLLRSNGVRVCAIDLLFEQPLNEADDDVEVGINVLTDVDAPELVERLTEVSSAPYDLVIHSAGISAVGAFDHVDAAAMDALLRTNFLAPMRITRDLSSSGKVTADATHVFLASLSCFTGYPGAAAYAASKEGLWAFARCLGESVRHTGGNVVTVFPGPTDTPHAMKYSPDNSRRHRRACPDALAGIIWRAACNDHRVVFGKTTEALVAWAAYLVPHAAARLMGKWMLSKQA